MNFFKDMIDEGNLDTSNRMHLECIWLCFSKIIQKELNEIRDEWNNHYIRKSRHHTASGIPNALYFLPESVGTTDYKHPYNLEDLEEVNNEIHSPNDSNESYIYQEYLSYVEGMIGIAEPITRMDAVELYQRLLQLAQ